MLSVLTTVTTIASTSAWQTAMACWYSNGRNRLHRQSSRGRSIVFTKWCQCVHPNLIHGSLSPWVCSPKWHLYWLTCSVGLTVVLSMPKSSYKNCPLPCGGPGPPPNISWVHLSLPAIQYWFIRLCRAHSRDRQTDRQTIRPATTLYQQQ